MSQEQQITAEQQVLLLKARLFDANEQLHQMNQNLNEFAQGFQRLINIAGIAGENGQVSIGMAVEAIAEQLESFKGVGGDADGTEEVQQSE